MKKTSTSVCHGSRGKSCSGATVGGGWVSNDRKTGWQIVRSCYYTMASCLFVWFPRGCSYVVDSNPVKSSFLECKSEVGLLVVVGELKAGSPLCFVPPIWLPALSRWSGRQCRAGDEAEGRLQLWPPPGWTHFRDDLLWLIWAAWITVESLCSWLGKGSQQAPESLAVSRNA